MKKAIRYTLTMCSAAVLLGCSAPAQAQTVDYGSLEELFGEPITTSATGMPQRAPDVPVKMDIITAEDIRRSGAIDIPSVLRSVAGMSVWQWTRTQEDVSMRGYNQAFSPRLLVLVNGRQVYLDNYGYTAWEVLPVQLGEIRQIEIVKGPNSALFGFNAVGGVINIVTYNPMYDDVTSVSATAGTKNYYHGNLINTVKPTEDVGVRLSASGMRMDNFKTSDYRYSPLQPPWSGTMSLDSVVNVTDNSQLRFEASEARSEIDEYVYLYIKAHAVYDMRSLKATYVVDTDKLGQITASAYRNWLATRLPRTFAGRGFDFLNVVTVAQISDIFQAGNNHHFRVGAEYRQNELGGELLTEAGSHLGYNIYALNGMWQWGIRDGLTLTNAVREDHLQLWRTGTVTPTPFYTSNADFDRIVTAFSFNSGLVWNATPEDTWRLTVSRGVQSPSLTEFGQFQAVIPPVNVGNPNIEPTVITNYEVGYDREIDRIDGALSNSVFFQSTRHLKSTNVNFSFPFYQADNIGNSHSIGWESELKGKVDKNWSWDVNYTLQRVTDDLTVNTGPVTLVPYDSAGASPLHTLNAHVGYQKGPWEADLFGHYVSRYKVLNNNLTGTYSYVEVPHYVSLNGRVGYKLNDNVTIALSGQELNHQGTKQTSGPKSERQGFLTITADF